MAGRIAQGGLRRYVRAMKDPATLEICIEVCKGAFTKRRPDGSVDFVSPLPSPFAYGSVLGSLAEDGDPEDALVVGVTPELGSTVIFPVWGRVRFVDAGVDDHKWVTGPRSPTELEWRHIERFFRFYAVAKRVLYLLRRASGPTSFEGVERHAPPSG